MKGYNLLYARSREDPLAFWKKQADRVDWFAFPKSTLSKDLNGLWRWFEGGQTNTCYLAVDRHVSHGRGDQPAVFYDSPVTESKRTITYAELKYEVSRLAGALAGLGIDKGDRVIIYMPMIPEAVFAMLACARIGAVHSVVFGGFAAEELRKRIEDSQAKVLLTASCGVEVNRIIPYKPIVDRALGQAKRRVDKVVLLQRPQATAEILPERDLDWVKLVEASEPVDCVRLRSTDPLYVIYTSGTTGQPKGVLRDNGGHAVAMDFSMEMVYDMAPGDVFWAASDLGWIVGHSYIVYGPLIRGCSTVLYEGKPVNTPDAGAFWRVVEEYGVNALFAAPTAFRAIIGRDPDGRYISSYNRDTLKYLFLAGERCDVSTLKWLTDKLDIPVIDHWWQTESGWPMLANMAGVELLPVRPGSAGKPVCGYEMKIVDQAGHELPPGQEGALLVRCPLPPGSLVSLWNDRKRFETSYMSAYPGYFLTGDGAHCDEDGYYYISGRMDDVINVAGHRLSTAALEEVVSSHPSVSECAVIGMDDSLKGSVPIAIVVLKGGACEPIGGLEGALTARIRARFGAIAALKHVLVAKRLPKTRSGKILRSALRSIADGHPPKSVSTIDDPRVLDEMVALFSSLEKLADFEA